MTRKRRSANSSAAFDNWIVQWAAGDAEEVGPPAPRCYPYAELGDAIARDFTMDRKQSRLRIPEISSPSKITLMSPLLASTAYTAPTVAPEAFRYPGAPTAARYAIHSTPEPRVLGTNDIDGGVQADAFIAAACVEALLYANNCLWMMVIHQKKGASNDEIIARIAIDVSSK